LEQTAAAADTNGVFSSNCPSGGGITDYALLWFEALSLYLKATGDTATVNGLYPAATKCMDYFLSSQCYDPTKGFNPKGLGMVIDWGYTAPDHYNCNMALGGLLLSALKALVHVSKSVKCGHDYSPQLSAHSALLAKLLDLSDIPTVDPDAWHVLSEEDWNVKEGLRTTGLDFTTVGFHATCLLLRTDLFDSPTRKPDKAAAIAYIKNSLSKMFPINPEGAWNLHSSLSPTLTPSRSLSLTLFLACLTP